MVPALYPVPGMRARLAELERVLRQFQARQRTRYGIYVEDLQSGLSLNLNGNDAFIAASTTKFPVSLYVFYKASVGQLDLSAQVEYQPQDRTAGTGVIQLAPYGTRYSLRQLCYHAIVDSDNVAWRMLYRTLGEPAIKAWMRIIGGRQAVSGVNVASPADYGVYYKFLLEFAERQPGYGGTLLDWLKRSGYTEWAPRHLPPAVPTAHKIGAWPTAINDVGVVFLPRAPYLLCLMSDLTQDQRLGLAIDNLAHIGQTAYQYLRPQAGKFAAVHLGGTRLPLGLPAALMGGHLMVPIREVAEALGARVAWDGAAQRVTISRQGVRLRLTVGSMDMEAGGSTRPLPHAPFLFEQQTVAPLRAVAEALGARVEWDPDRFRALLSL